MLVFETVLEFLDEIEVCYLSVVAKDWFVSQEGIQVVRFGGLGSLPWLLINTTPIIPTFQEFLQAKWMC